MDSYTQDSENALLINGYTPTWQILETMHFVLGTGAVPRRCNGAFLRSSRQLVSFYERILTQCRPYTVNPQTQHGDAALGIVI